MSIREILKRPMNSDDVGDALVILVVCVIAALYATGVIR